MAYQTIFKRYELKYMLNIEQKEKLIRFMEPYMALGSIWKINDSQCLL